MRTMQIREQLEQLIDAAVAAACEDGTLTLEQAPEAALERPRDESNGDWASTVAMRSAKLAKKNPREIAQIIVDHLPENDMIASVDIAGPGFINIRLANAVLQGVVAAARAEKDDFGKGEIPEGERKINLEYISANPTGPLHVGHGRWAALGDATARVMRHAGYDVFEEFYINDAGTQMDNFGESVAVRYQQLLGRDVEMPEACYAGSYVKDIAQTIIDEDGDKWLDADPKERMENFRERAGPAPRGQHGLAAGDVAVVVGAPDVDEVVEAALHLVVVVRHVAHEVRHLAVGLDEHAILLVVERAGPEPGGAVLDVDVALLVHGLEAAVHRAQTVLIGHVQRALGEPASEGGAEPLGDAVLFGQLVGIGALEIMLGQLVNLFRDGEAVRMSKRTGEMITFEELIDEVGVDATRYLMLAKSSDQPIDFDIEVAKKKDASNPVYYVQYAHARICSILRKAADPADAEAAANGDMSMDELASKVIPANVDLSPLTHESELALMRKMDDFGPLVAQAARDRAAFRLTHYAQDLASLFHSFYTNCHVIGEEEAVTNARLALVDATRIVLAKTLNLLGVSAPAKM